VVTVTAPDGKPIHRATIQQMVSGNGGAALGETDESGTCVLLDLEPHSTVEVGARGFSALTHLLSEQVPAELAFTLQPLGCVTGRVFVEGPPPPEPITVIAFADEWSEFSKRPLEDPATRVTTAQADGSFRICGLPEGATWTLLAGTPGFACPQPVPGIPTGHQQARLTIEEYSHVALQLVDESGQPPCVVGALTKVETGFACVVPLLVDRQWLWLKPTQAALAGVPLDWCEVGPTRRLAFAPRRLVSPDARAIRCNVRLPGYADCHPAFAWSPLSEGFRAQNIPLQSAASARGTIRVHVEFCEAMNLGDVHPLTPLLEVELDSERLQRPIGVGITCGGGVGTAEIDCLPVGSYQARLRYGSPFEHIEPKGVVEHAVEVGGDGHVRFRLEETGAMELIVVAAKGERYDGLLSAVVGRVAGGQARETRGFLTYERGPYVVPFAPAGAYHVRLDYPRARARGSVQEAQSLVVEQGTLRSVEFELAEAPKRKP
jgi:hypothetical protein